MGDRNIGCLVGLACGDAVGTTVEFLSRDTFDPVTEMTGGGPFNLKPGQWTDDTSMALCIADSLIENEGFDLLDQIERYIDWVDTGYNSSTGKMFDVGNTVLSALESYRATGNPLSGDKDPDASGNGSIMRLCPVPMAYQHNHQLAIRLSVQSSKTTHQSPDCLAACGHLALIILRALSGETEKLKLLEPDSSVNYTNAIQQIASGSFKTKTRDQVRGSGWCVASLEAALWAFWNTDTFKDAILAAVNLGDDADTTAAICGQVAGAYYGLSGIPTEWVNTLYQSTRIKQVAEDLHKLSERLRN